MLARLIEIGLDIQRLNQQSNTDKSGANKHDKLLQEAPTSLLWISGPSERTSTGIYIVNLQVFFAKTFWPPTLYGFLFPLEPGSFSNAKKTICFQVLKELYQQKTPDTGPRDPQEPWSEQY